MRTLLALTLCACMLGRWSDGCLFISKTSPFFIWRNTYIGTVTHRNEYTQNSKQKQDIDNSINKFRYPLYSEQIESITVVG